MASKRLSKSENPHTITSNMEPSEYRFHNVVDELLDEWKSEVDRRHEEKITELALEAQRLIKKASEKGRKENDALKEQIRKMTEAWTKERKDWETQKQDLSKDLDPNLFTGLFCT
jgi:F0F1-type ATP synthase membrane subunit b/b'